MSLPEGQSCSKVNPICSAGDKLLLGEGDELRLEGAWLALMAWNRSSGHSIGAAGIS